VASDINTCTFSGRLVKDPEARNGGKTAAFSIAIQRSVRQEDGSWTDAVDFVDVSAFNGLASLILKKAVKADRVVVHGRLSQSTWTVDGQRRSRLAVIANQVIGEYAYRSEERSRPGSAPIRTAVDRKADA
jgi:single-strand DNA-binding protein